MPMRRQSARMRKHVVVNARWRPEVVVDPLSMSTGRAGPTKAEPGESRCRGGGGEL
jgi:hypothetical protein